MTNFFSIFLSDRLSTTWGTDAPGYAGPGAPGRGNASCMSVLRMEYGGQPMEMSRTTVHLPFDGWPVNSPHFHSGTPVNRVM